MRVFLFLYIFIHCRSTHVWLWSAWLVQLWTPASLIDTRRQHAAGIECCSVCQCVHCVALLATVRVRREAEVARVVCCTRCSNLQRVAVYCSVLQYAAVSWQGLPAWCQLAVTRAVHCNTLQNTATRCSTLCNSHHGRAGQRPATHVNILQDHMNNTYNTLQHKHKYNRDPNTTQIQHCQHKYNTVQHTYNTLHTSITTPYKTLHCTNQ